MEMRTLGRSGIRVSLICLGTMTWGEQNTEAEAFEQMDYAVERGINFFDTAELYAVPARAETYGLTETYIGNWMKSRNCRDKIILASKVAGPGERLSWIRGGTHRLDRKNIRQALEDSLRRLQTDYIDLYQLHWPDRKTNFFGQMNYVHDPEDRFVPLEDTLQALDELVIEGKIRQIGVSNETPWGLMTYLGLTERKSYPRMASIQNPYSLLNRLFEVGLSEVSMREECGLLAYSPLGCGVLSGKYLDGQNPPGARLTLWGEYFDRYTNPQAVAATREYVELARKHGLNPSQMALGFVNSRDFVTSNIIGATSMAQLKENIDSVNVRLTPEILAEIEAIHERHPNPSS